MAEERREEQTIGYLPWGLSVNAEILKHRAEGQAKGQAWGRFCWLLGGRRIRKTDWLLNRLLEATLKSPPGSDLAYVNRTLKRSRLMAWKRLKAKFRRPNDVLLAGRPNEQQMNIPVVGDRTIWVVGTEEDPESSLGAGFCHLAVDEASVNQSLAHAWEQVFLPMLSDKMGTADFVYTARGQGWHHQQWRKGVRGGATYTPAHLAFEVWTKAAGTVPQEALDHAKGELGLDLYRQEYECVALGYVGLAVHAFVNRLVADGGHMLERGRYERIRKSLTYYGVLDYARSSGTTIRLVYGVDAEGRPGFVSEIVMPGGTPARVGTAAKEQDVRAGVSTVVTIGGRDCFSRESSGKSMADLSGMFMAPCPFRLEDAIHRLNMLCEEEHDGPDGEPLPGFWILEGTCPQLTRQLMRIQFEDLEKKTQNRKDALDCARMAVMADVRGLREAMPDRAPTLEEERSAWITGLLRGKGGGGLHPVSGRPLA